MPQCLPSCSERSLGSRTPRLANPKPRRCLHGTQSTSVGTPLHYVTRNLAKQRPPAFHCTRDPIVRWQLWEERNERNILEATLPHSDDLELASSTRLTPSCLSTHMWCVCIYRVIRKESALLWEMIVWVILSKKVHIRAWVRFWTVTELWGCPHVNRAYGTSWRLGAYCMHSKH